MLHFEWSAFVTPDMLRQLAAASGAPLATAQALALRLARLLEHVGGLPYIDEEPSPEARTAQGLGWLDEALGHTLAESGVRRAPPGLLPGPGNSRCAQLLTARPLLHANLADVDGWRTLPGVTVALAQAIVAERDRRGRFASLDDFEKRVDGIGSVRAAALAGVLSFLGNPAAVAGAGALTDWTSRLQALMRLQHAATPAQALVGAVNQTLASVATQAHPASRDGLLRSTPAAALMNPASAVRAAWVGELWGKHYWQALPVLMDNATQHIDVCMFHVAAPSETHPTYALLQGLVRAHQRGTVVRVLLDRDGKSDPYLSTLINSAARRFLTAAGVACRSDSSSRLLHSKYLLIDRQLVVMGSHNWSAGSYGRFDDLTLAVHSEPLASQVLVRFDALWASAS